MSGSKWPGASSALNIQNGKGCPGDRVQIHAKDRCSLVAPRGQAVHRLAHIAFGFCRTLPHFLPIIDYCLPTTVSCILSTVFFSRVRGAVHDRVVECARIDEGLWAQAPVFRPL